MGILDFFKKKKKNDVPENDLEKLLREAVTNESYRKEFYTKLLWCDLYVITYKKDIKEPTVRLSKEGEHMDVASFEDGSIPVFTSTDRIFDNGVIKHQVAYAGMKGQHLFEMLKGARIIINPYSDYGKEMLPAELDDLLSGAIFDPEKNVRHEHITVKEQTKVTLGVPSNYPAGLVNVLSEKFKSIPEVLAGYIALIDFEGENNPHLILGIELTDISFFKELSPVIGELAYSIISKNEVIDIIPVTRTEKGISDYMVNETRPFYKKG